MYKRQILLSYTGGLDRYYGLLDLGIKYGLFTKEGTRIVTPQGKKVFAKHINQNPEEYFDSEVLSQLDGFAKQEYSYGTAGSEMASEDITSEESA